MSLPRPAGDNVIRASCTLIAASQVSDGTRMPSSAITLHTSSQKIVVPISVVSPSPDKQSLQDDGSARSSVVGPTMVMKTSSSETAAATGAAHKPASQKTNVSNPVTRRVRFQAKPNISKNARTR